ncbi:glycosyltransferase family 4 protein [Pseudorhodobacter sp. W20_MBD10_FR17]|uniref:glycosyltransferase family 4 protein n=1 Tax=Pseudorhodobacter sp. W20_MBD10_FR17 TaxID=3240266 RepID=UPI003F99D76D
MRPAAFAIPGDYEQLTGGFIYERSLLLTLRDAGRVVDHLQLPAGFPNPTQEETAATHAILTAVPADVPVILDGLVFGSIDPAVLDAMQAPVVAMLHHPLGLETGIKPETAQFLLAREAENLTRAAHVVVPSPHTAAILQSEFGVAPERITIALPGFARPDATKAAPSTPPLILSVGLLAARKGHDTLIDALAQITDLDWQAEIVGGPHDPDVAVALATQISALGLQNRVRLAGVLARPELDQRYRSASLFALATRYEGYGMVFGEAMLHGLPIVSCQTGAVPDTIAKDAGLLVPVDAPDAFAHALRQILTDAKTRRAMASASAVGGNKLPSWADAAAIMGRVLDGCCG